MPPMTDPSHLCTPAGADGDSSAPLPHIPRVLHQTFPVRDLPPQFAANVAALKQQNPSWSHVLYDDDDIRDYIRDHYGAEVAERFNRINPAYGAARADLFRYLLMYREGGVYLDIKSGLERPLDALLLPGDRFILAQWDTTVPGRETFGVHAELADLAGGEFQQWHIIAGRQHPFLQAVIERVLHAIDTYSPWRVGTGGKGTYRVTGPVAYTLAIQPLLASHPHRRVTDTDAGIIYNATPASHKKAFAGHYLTRTDPVVLPIGAARLSSAVYSGLQRIRRAARTPLRQPS